MSSESFGNYEQAGNQEQVETQKYNLSLLNDTQKQIEGEARDYVLREQKNGRDITELIQNITPIIEKQRNENEFIEKQIQSEAREGLDKEALINEAKTQIYEMCGISDNIDQNSSFENFSKGFIDEMILGNYDMAIEVINTKGEVILNALKQLATLEGLKQIAEALGESINDLFTGNAYEKGKSVAELGLTGIGVYAGIKGVKLGIKQISKLRVNKEKIVKSSDVKDVVLDVEGKIDTIIPKKKFDFEENVEQSKIKVEKIDKLDIEKIPGFNELFDGKKGNTLKDSITKEQLSVLINNNEILKGVFEKYKSTFGNIIDPDKFRELFKDYKGINSADFDDIVGKLSKIYYRMTLYEAGENFKKAIRLIGGAPGSGKSFLLEKTNSGKINTYGATFDSTLSDSRFIKYLQKEAKNEGLNTVDIDFIHRRPDVAWEGVVLRAIETGRAVNVSYFAETYKNVIMVMNTLKGGDGVNIRLFDNSGGKANIKEVGIDSINQIAEQGLNKQQLIDIVDRHINKKIDKISLDKTFSDTKKIKMKKQLEKLKIELLK